MDSPVLYLPLFPITSLAGDPSGSGKIYLSFQKGHDIFSYYNGKISPDIYKTGFNIRRDGPFNQCGIDTIVDMQSSGSGICLLEIDSRVENTTERDNPMWYIRFMNLEEKFISTPFIGLNEIQHRRDQANVPLGAPICLRIHPNGLFYVMLLSDSKRTRDIVRIEPDNKTRSFSVGYDEIYTNGSFCFTSTGDSILVPYNPPDEDEISPFHIDEYTLTGEKIRSTQIDELAMGVYLFNDPRLNVIWFSNDDEYLYQGFLPSTTLARLSEVVYSHAINHDSLGNIYYVTNIDNVLQIMKIPCIVSSDPKLFTLKNLCYKKLNP